VTERHSIPAWTVIGGYTGKMVSGGGINKDSQHMININMSMFIDAEKKETALSTSHRCQDFNASFL